MGIATRLKLARLMYIAPDTGVVASLARGVFAGGADIIALADDVLYLADGRVLAHGRHEELMDSVAAYRTLIEAFEHDRASVEGGAS